MFTEHQAPKGQKRPPAGPALGPGHPAGAGCADRHAELLCGPLSPIESFLRYLTLPQDNELAIDLRQMGSLQEVIGWVLIGWKYYANVIGPIQCKGLANLGVTQIACAEKRFLILSRNGRVYTQAYNSDTLVPQLVQGLASRNIVKIAAHSDGHHYLALAATGEVYSWGCGDGRWLGHRDTVPLEEPKVISAFSGKQAGKHVVHIACRKHLQRSRHCRGGAAHLGPWELWPAGPQYIWSASVGACSRRWPLTGLNKRPSYLFEGSSEDEAILMLVAGLKGLKVIDVACGSGDAQTLAVTENGKKVIDVAAGSTHCLALTEDSEVHSWRSNDQCQHFDTLRVTKPEPAALPGLDAKHIVGVTCGPAQSCAWSSCSEWSIGLRVPLGVDICSVTFQQLDLLLQQVSEGMDGSADWPPPHEKECMAVATLNLPRLQLHAAISHQVDPEFLGLGLGSVLLNSLKQTVVTLASSTGMLSTVHSASQAMLQSGWSVLLPTAEKQARALSALLPCAVSGNEVNISPGRRFMIDLLVGSLMAAGGLESALHAAITAEIQDIEAKKEAQKEKEIDEQEANASAFHRSRTPLDKDLINTGICESSGKHCLPLVQLIQQHLSQCERMVSIVLEGPTRRRWEEVRLSL
ncbi:E3 ubiquitin-protein ligase HERC2-like isoform X6 [Pongo pygmaeus]